MKVLMFYDVTPEGLAKAQAHYPAHVVRLQQFHSRGVLLMAGPYGNPPTGALGIFTSREAAEEFVKGDQEVLHVARP